jgi:hypothetical protein
MDNPYQLLETIEFTEDGQDIDIFTDFQRHLLSIFLPEKEETEEE